MLQYCQWQLVSVLDGETHLWGVDIYTLINAAKLRRFKEKELSHSKQ